jgi:tetratricopeptide (TPR) repeat protein
MTTKLLSQFRGWLASRSLPWFAPFWKAKKLHESSPHGLFNRTFYHALTPDEIEGAARCPQLAKAIELYKECIGREVAAGRIFNQGVALQQLGLVYHRQGKLDAARKAYQDGLDLFEDLPDAEALAPASTCHFRLAEICLREGKREEALSHLEKSRSIDEGLNDQNGLTLSSELLRLIC